MKHLFLTLSLILSLFVSSSSSFCLTFDLTVLDEGMSDPWLKSIGDLDGDGKTDIVVGGDGKCGLVSYLNRFPDWKRVPIDLKRSFSTDGECADIDGDGRNDFVAITRGKDEGIVWYRNSDSGWKFNALSETPLHDIELGDIDGDGMVDLLGRNQMEWPNGDDNGNRLYVIYQRRDVRGSISWEKTVVPCPPGEGLLLADLDGDTDKDIVVNGVWFENTGPRQWQAHDLATDDGWNYPNTFIALGDINGDGRGDLLLSPSELKDGSYKVSWLECPIDPKGIWTEHTIDPEVETVLHYIGSADFDGDGRMDAVTAEMPQGSDPDEIKIYSNHGSLIDGLWKDNWIPTTICINGSHSMRILDVNCDGLPDLFGANWRANGQDEFVKLWVNKSSSSNSHK